MLLWRSLIPRYVGSTTRKTSLTTPTTGPRPLTATPIDETRISAASPTTSVGSSSCGGSSNLSVPRSRSFAHAHQAAALERSAPSGASGSPQKCPHKNVEEISALELMLSGEADFFLMRTPGSGETMSEPGATPPNRSFYSFGIHFPLDFFPLCISLRTLLCSITSAWLSFSFHSIVVCRLKFSTINTLDSRYWEFCFQDSHLKGLPKSFAWCHN